jgi:hypothetical protein
MRRNLCSLITNSQDYNSKKDRDAHFHQDYHNLNVKRTKIQGKTAISVQDWDTGDFDNESIDGSDDESDTEVDINKSSPFACFHNQSTNTNALVYKNIFLSGDKYKLERLKDVKSSGKTCAILAIGAGHFAGAGISCYLIASFQMSGSS